MPNEFLPNDPFSAKPRGKRITQTSEIETAGTTSQAKRIYLEAQAATVPGWRQNIQRIRSAGGVVVGNGSFSNGKYSAEFFVGDARTRVGRRNVTNEFPHSDKADFEDLGRKTPSYSLTAWVLEPQYFTKRNKLLLALEEPGSGILVHPFLGRKKVIIKDMECTETFDEGGMARFELTFDEVRKQQQPRFSEDVNGAVEDKIAAARSGIVLPWIQKYNLNGPGFLTVSLMADIGRLMYLIKTALRVLSTPLTFDVVQRIIQETVEILESLQGLALSGAEAIADTIYNLFMLAQDLTSAPLAGVAGSGVVLTPNTAAVDFGCALGLFDRDSVYRTAPEPILGTTTYRLQQAQNREAFQALTRRMAVLGTAQILLKAKFTTTEEVKYCREQFHVLVDPILLEVADDEDDIYELLTDLASATVKYLNEQESSGTLATVERPIVPMGVLSSLVLAYRKYGDIAREDELVRNNLILHNGFLQGGQPVTLLSE